MFEHSLIDLEEKKQRRRFAPLPIAISLHLVVLGSIAMAQMWNVEEVEEPPIPVIGFYGDPPPPPPPPAGVRKPTQAPTQKPVTPQMPVQPDADRIPETPADAPADTGTILAEGDPFGSPDGVAGGVDIGVPGGVLDSAGTGSIGWGGKVVDPEPRNEVVRFNGTMTRPVQLSGRQPRYSELARRAGIQGTVILEAVIDKAGRVSNVRILKGLPMGLDAEAVSAVQEWVFEPARLDGRPVSVYYTLTVNFQIQR
jgi:periplasmic protein TonB